MKEFKDQMNQTIRLSEMPRRIVSLVPSQTELLYDLGLIDEVVGITKFCIYPDEWYHSKKRVGGTKDVSLDKIISLFRINGTHDNKINYHIKWLPLHLKREFL